MHKATSPDQIPTWLLKELSVEIAPVLAVFFQASLGQGVIPNDWKTANVVLVFKKAEKNRPENYRPVPLTSIMCKLLEHIVCRNIMRHADTHRILTDAQHGFRKRHSCETQLLLTIQELGKNVGNKGQVDIIILVFSRAFNKVPHKR